MNKAEAIEVIRKNRPDASFTQLREALETLIPELKESEDERIRKELIEQVGYIIPDKEEYDEDGRILPTYHKRIGRYRAYLEKQRERGPLTNEEEYTLQRIIEHLEDDCCPQSWKDLLHDIYCLPYEKQKPVGWGEEDDRKRNGLIKGLEDRMGFGWASDLFSREEYIAWLKSLRPSWKPSKKQMEALGDCVLGRTPDADARITLEILWDNLQKLL